MAWLRKHKIASQKPGQVISAQDLRHAGETLDWLSNIQAAPPLEILSTANGPLLRYPGMLFEAYIAITTSTITARSGSTPGTGTAKVETWNGSALADLGGPVSFTVYSVLPAPIASGAYVNILRIAGNYWIVTPPLAATVDLWCRLSGSLGPATGTWPSLTATTTTADVYQGSGTGLAPVASGATIYNRRDVTWAAGKTTFLVPSGGGYAIVDQDC